MSFAVVAESVGHFVAIVQVPYARLFVHMLLHYFSHFIHAVSLISPDVECLVIGLVVFNTARDNRRDIGDVGKSTRLQTITEDSAWLPLHDFIHKYANYIPIFVPR